MDKAFACEDGGVTLSFKTHINHNKTESVVYKMLYFLFILWPFSSRLYM